MTHQDLFSRLSDGINSPTFLTGLGVTGTITTAYFTGRASFRAAQLIAAREAEVKLDPNDLEKTPGLSNKEKVKLVWPLYVAPASICATTITAIILANHEASKKIAALTVASGLSERALTEYKAKVAEKIGKAKETQVRDEIAQDRVNKNPPSSREVIIAESGDVLCFDQMTGRYFKSNMEKLRQGMNNLNYEIIAHDYASLSFFYDQIGLAPTAYSDYVGWRIDDHPDLQFSTVMSLDDRPCLAIDFDVAPHPGYSQLW